MLSLLDTVLCWTYLLHLTEHTVKLPYIEKKAITGKSKVCGLAGLGTQAQALLAARTVYPALHFAFSSVGFRLPFYLQQCGGGSSRPDIPYI